MNVLLLLDIVLILTLLATAWFSLTTPNLLRSVILFIAFGLLVALAWVRLQAPDVAIAEAAIGSGLTGALLLSALNAMQRARPTADSPADDSRSGGNSNIEEKGAERVPGKP